MKTGILLEITGQTRNRRFRYDSYVRLFTDDKEEDDKKPGTSR